MHLTIDRANLLKPLDTLNRIVDRRQPAPILSNLLLRAEGGKLSISATDLDMAATVTVAAEIRTPGAVTAPALTLKDIIRKLPDGCQAEMRVADDNARMTLRAGRSRFTLPVLPASDWPEIADAPAAATFEVMGVEAESMLDGVKFAISTEETRYYLNGVYLHVPPGEAAGLRAVATDGHRMAVREVVSDIGPITAMPGVIVPRKAVAELHKMAEAALASVIQFTVSPTILRATCGNVSLTTKLIDGNYPDYERVIPKHNPTKATLERESLMRAVERVATVVEGRSRAIKFAFADDGLTVSATAPESGAAEETIDCAIDGEPVEIGFNARYALDLLEVVKADQVEVSLSDGGSPALFRGLSEEAEGHTLVLMPMRV